MWTSLRRDERGDPNADDLAAAAHLATDRAGCVPSADRQLRIHSSGASPAPKRREAGTRRERLLPHLVEDDRDAIPPLLEDVRRVQDRQLATVSCRLMVLGPNVATRSVTLK